MINQASTEDALSALGKIALGSRLKRLSELLYAQANYSLKDEGFEIAPNQVPLLLTLDSHGPMTVGEMSNRLRISQPAVTRIVKRLTMFGILEFSRVKTDQHQTVFSLSQFGDNLFSILRTKYLPKLDFAMDQILEVIPTNFLTHIQILEDALKLAPLNVRIAGVDKDELV